MWLGFWLVPHEILSESTKMFYNFCDLFTKSPGNTLTSLDTAIVSYLIFLTMNLDVAIDYFFWRFMTKILYITFTNILYFASRVLNSNLCILFTKRAIFDLWNALLSSCLIQSIIGPKLQISKLEEKKHNYGVETS